jgi:VWFA-related protein
MILYRSTSVAVAGLVACVIGLSAQASARQQQAPTFRTTVDVARVTVRVLDKARRPVPGLSAADFAILVDGRPRPIVAFATEDAAGPVTTPARWMRDVAPDVAANTLERPRLVVIIIDDGLIPRDGFVLEATKKSARTVLEQLGPNDLAAVVFTRDNRAPQDFTADRARLRAAIDGTTYGVDPRDKGRFDRGNPSLELMRSYSRNTLKAAQVFLRGAPDLRSLIVYISVGAGGGEFAALQLKHDVEREVAEQANDLVSLMADASDASHVTSVPVYAISPLGMVAPGPSATQPYSNRGIHGPAGLNEWLKTVSSLSGGKAIIATNTPAEEVPRIFAENRLYYMLGYELPGPMEDGRYRRISVRVNRPNVIVEPHGDRLVLAPKAGGRMVTPPATARALSGLVPLADDPLRLAVAAFAEPAATAAGPALARLALTLGIEVAEPALDDAIAVQVRVFDGEGRKELQVRDETLRVSRTSQPGPRRIDALLSLALPAGRYNLRVATHSTRRDRVGSVYTDVTIPDFRRAPLSLSDVMLSAVPGPLPWPLETGAAVLPASPTTARAFAPTDRVAAHVRVYWGENSRLGTVTLHATITNIDDRHVLELTTALNPGAGPANDLRATDYRLDLPLTDLKAGEYLLTLAAAPAGAIATTTRRHVRFRVE